MSRIRVKICGITSLEDLYVAVQAGADAIGFVVDFPQSPRNLSIEETKKLIKQIPPFIEPVIVTVYQDNNHLKKILEEFSSNVIQIHGLIHSYIKIKESFPNIRLIVALQAESDQIINDAKEVSKLVDAILLDSYSPGKYGGTATTHDWKISKQVKEVIQPRPLILAGGLTPKNIKRAISAVNPYAVDVSSGVELRPGIKDPKKVIEFIRNAR